MSASSNLNLSRHLSSVSIECARLMSEPMWNASEELISSVLPNREEDTLKKTQCYVFKMFNGSMALFSLLIALPLALTSEVPRAIGNYFMQDNFTYVTGSAPSKSCPPLPERHLSILSLNTCGMPGGIGWIYGGIAPWRQRIDLIVKKIRNVDCDVVCLQEVHDQRLAQKIVQLLKDKYLFAVYHIGQKEMGMGCFLDSGLMVLSKYKIVDPRFTSFIQVEGSQKDVNKGCFDFALETQFHEKIAHIFATHLEPSPDDFNPSLKEQRTRMLELELIMEKMEIIVKEKHKDMPIILVGDLNVAYKGKEYRGSVLERNFYNGLSKKALKTCTSRFSDYMWTYSAEKRDKIALRKEVTLDYILILKSLPRIGKDQAIKNVLKMTSHVDTRRMYDESYPEGALSDHNALAGIILYDLENKQKFVSKSL